MLGRGSITFRVYFALYSQLCPTLLSTGCNHSNLTNLYNSYRDLHNVCVVKVLKQIGLKKEN